MKFDNALEVCLVTVEEKEDESNGINIPNE